MEILIVEDEKRIADSLKRNFLSEGHHAIIAFDGEDALKKSIRLNLMQFFWTGVFQKYLVLKFVEEFERQEIKFP